MAEEEALPVAAARAEESCEALPVAAARAEESCEALPVAAARAEESCEALPVSAARAEESCEALPSSPSSYYSQYPPIDPTTFDLIVCGSGLSESILAASAASVGKSVLHLERNTFYGSHFSSLSLPALLSFLNPSDDHAAPPPSANKELADVDVVDLHCRRLYSDVETFGSYPESSRAFMLDLAGPRVLYCSDEMVDLLIRSGASYHVEFKCINATLMYWQGKFCPVPESREAIFRDHTLSLVEKNQLTKFLKLIQGHIALEQNAQADEEEVVGIPAEDLEKPFADFLQSKGLHPKIRMMILHAITLAEYDQEDAESCKKLITTKDGIDSLALYMKSVARFAGEEGGAFLYPMYGHVELSQAFCRCAAVQGAALQVFGMPVSALLVDKETRQYKGVRLATGQDMFSSQVVMDPSFEVPYLKSPSNVVCEEFEASNFSGKIAKGICITSSSILQYDSNALVIFPPRSLFSEQSATIRVLQLSPNALVSPPGFFVVYFSVSCDDALRGKQYIKAAINALFLVADDGMSGNDSLSPNSEIIEGQNKPAVKWHIFYVQDQKQVSSDTVHSCPMPDERLDYRNLLETTKELFATMYPQDEFLPASSASNNIEEDESLPEQIDESLPEKIDESLPKKIDESQPEQIDESLPEKIDESLPKKIDESQPEQIDESLPKKIDESQPEQIDESLPKKIDESQPEKIDESQPEKI